MAGVVRWLYALGIGWLMYAVALFLFTLYRSTPEAMFAAGLCAAISAVLFVAAIAVNFRQKQIYSKRDTKSVQLSNRFPNHMAIVIWDEGEFSALVLAYGS